MLLCLTVGGSMRNLGLLYLLYFCRNINADINPVDKTYRVEPNEPYTIRWEYDNETSMLFVTWRYTNSSDLPTTTVITKLKGSNAVPVAGYAINHEQNGDITLQNVTDSYSGIYYCIVTYTGMSALQPVTGTATIQLKIAPTKGDTGGLSTGAIAGIVTAVVVGLGILVVVILARLGKLPCNGDTSKDNVGTRSSPKKDEKKLLDNKKQIKILRKDEGVKKEKPVKQTQDLDRKIHQENEGKKPGRDLPPPSVGAIHSSQLSNIQSPGHDSKGRGLLANFGDDDHPLVAIDIRAQKAGTLPLITDTPREDKKKTKKKKKDKQEDKSFLDI